MKLHSGLLCIALSLLGSASAGAVTDLTGTYEGKLRCTTTTDGVVAKTKQEVSVGVMEGERVTTLEIFGIADRIIGRLIEDAVKSDRGILPAVSCGFSDFVQEGVVVRLEARTKEETLIRQLMIEGILAIQKGDKPQVLRERLKAFLTPKERSALAAVAASKKEPAATEA